MNTVRGELKWTITVHDVVKQIKAIFEFSGRSSQKSSKGAVTTTDAFRQLCDQPQTPESYSRYSRQTVILPYINSWKKEHRRVQMRFKENCQIT